MKPQQNTQIGSYAFATLEFEPEGKQMSQKGAQACNASDQLYCVRGEDNRTFFAMSTATVPLRQIAQKG